MNEWNGFAGERWKKSIDVDDFIKSNYKEYKEGPNFLSSVTKKTEKVLSRCQKLFEKENTVSVLDIDVLNVAGIDSFEAGYIDKKNEVIFGLQTDEPLKRIINPYGGIESANKAASSYGYQMDLETRGHFGEFRKSFGEGINDAYTKDIQLLKNNGVLHGLPEEYNRGMILGDYRRLALYGADHLIARKERDLDKLKGTINFAMIRAREEIKEQVKALQEIKKMASRYDIDISRPASNTIEAVQWLYFAYLATVKQNNGVVNAFGRNSTFLDIYIERDITEGNISENEVQELIDQLFIKLRLVRHLRNQDTKEYLNNDSQWITESIGGMLTKDKSLITKTTYRFLHTLENLGVYSDPIFTVLWSSTLPASFKKHIAELSMSTNVIQFVNDDVMRTLYGTDYAIIGSSSAVKLGRQLMYYGANINLPKALLYALNNGRDENTKETVIEGLEDVGKSTLKYQVVVQNFAKILRKFANVYTDAMNITHYMHDKYSYESSNMAFLDTVIPRNMLFGISGLANVVDSLSVLEFGEAKVVRDKEGFVTEFKYGIDSPVYGNGNEEANKTASDVVRLFNHEIKLHALYRNSVPKITLQGGNHHFYYGTKTGLTPDRRESKYPFASASNPSSGFDTSGAIEAILGSASIPYDACSGGIATTVFIEPKAIGSSDSFNTFLEYYFKKGGQHISINVLEKNVVSDALSKLNNSLFMSINGCVIDYVSSSKEEQEEIMSKTFHTKL